MPCHLEVDPLGDPVDGLLQRVVMKGLHCTAPRADEVMMMLAAGVHRLEAGDAIARVNAGHEPRAV